MECCAEDKTVDLMSTLLFNFSLVMFFKEKEVSHYTTVYNVEIESHKMKVN